MKIKKAAEYGPAILGLTLEEAQDKNLDLVTQTWETSGIPGWKFTETKMAAWDSAIKDPERAARIRRRLEDRLRKEPHLALYVAALLVPVNPD